MRASPVGLVLLGWLIVAQAAHNVTVDHSETSLLTYFPASKWAELEVEHNVTATMASTIGAQVSFSFIGTAIYWLGFGSSDSSQFVEVTMDGVTVIVDVSSTELSTTSQPVAWWKDDLSVDGLHNITVRIIENDDMSADLYHLAFIYTMPVESGSQSSDGIFSIFGAPLTTATNLVTGVSPPITTPTTSTAEQPSGPNNRDNDIKATVSGTLAGVLGFGILVGGLVWYVRRQRLKKVDIERSSKSCLLLDGGYKSPPIGMIDTIIARARYGGVEPFVLPLGGQTPAAPPMETAVGGVTILQQIPREPSPARLSPF